MRAVTVGIVAALLTTSAYAQIPAGPGQLPGTLPPGAARDRAAAARRAAAGALGGHATAVSDLRRPGGRDPRAVLRRRWHKYALSYPKKRKNPRKLPRRPALTQ